MLDVYKRQLSGSMLEWTTCASVQQCLHVAGNVTKQENLFIKMCIRDRAMSDALSHADRYPDMACSGLKKAISEYFTQQGSSIQSEDVIQMGIRDRYLDMDAVYGMLREARYD